MGINFESGCVAEVAAEEEVERLSSLLRQGVRADVPLGLPGNHFCHQSEMGWSWWHRLKQHADERLGSAGAKHIMAVDAWFGVYVDAPIERVTLRLNPEPSEPEASAIAPVWRPTVVDRLRMAIGLAPKTRSADHVAYESLNRMFREFGPRPGERAVLQVSNLRGVLQEANRLLEQNGTACEQAAVESLLATYDDNERMEDDPQIQCLCHLWLTGTHALRYEQPMWLVK
ncbi:MAG: hypothetical protein U0570_08365 [Phycisphaerales bacterium]